MKIHRIIALLLLISFAASAVHAQEEAIDLGQLYVSDNGVFSFNYPDGWILQSAPNQVVLANSAMASNASADQLPADGVRVLLIGVLASDLGLGVDAAIDEIEESLFANLPDEYSAVESLTIGNRAALRTQAYTETNDVVILTVEMQAGFVIVLTAVTVPGGMESQEVTLRAIAGSFALNTAATDGEIVPGQVARLVQTASPNIEYFLMLPQGDAPPAGSPVVVAVYGQPGDGRTMARFLEREVQAGGVVLIAPSLGRTYSVYSRSEQGLLGILEEVGAMVPLDERGIVMYGISGGGQFASRFSSEHPELVAGIVAEGASRITPPPDDDTRIIYLYGELDGLLPIHQAEIVGYQQEGYPVQLLVQAGVGHQVTAQGIALTMQLVEELFAE